MSLKCWLKIQRRAHPYPTKQPLALQVSSTPSTSSSSPQSVSGNAFSAKQIHGSRNGVQCLGASHSENRWHLASQTATYKEVLGLFHYHTTYRQSYFGKQNGACSVDEQLLRKTEWSIGLFLWCLDRYFELRFIQSTHGQIERCLRVCPIDKTRSSPAWSICAAGDSVGLLRLFSQGVSPYIRDEAGKSLVNVSRTPD